jgi:hypothetical protein
MVMHASSSENTSYPLCRAPKFRYVTMSIVDVTCEGCILLLDGRGRLGPLVPTRGSDARAIVVGEKP